MLQSHQGNLNRRPEVHISWAPSRRHLVLGVSRHVSSAQSFSNGWTGVWPQAQGLLCQVLRPGRKMWGGQGEELPLTSPTLCQLLCCAPSFCMRSQGPRFIGEDTEA